MMNFDLIKPEFLKRADQYLLTHYPIIWQTRIIWVAFYSLSLFALAYFFGDYFDHEPGEILYPELSIERNHYYIDEKDDLGFGRIPLFLSGLVMVYWLYIQYQQKIDYSKLKIIGFLGTTLLNFICIGLILLPAIGLSYSAFDSERVLNHGLRMIQLVLTLSLSATILPFFIRQFSFIEIVAVIFIGIVYCFLISILLSFLDIHAKKTAFGVYLINYLILMGVASYRFYVSTYTQYTKRILLLCIMGFTFIFPYVLYLFGVYPSVNDAYLGVAPRQQFFHITNQWLVAHILVVLGIYGMFSYFIYRSLLFPIKRK